MFKNCRKLLVRLIVFSQVFPYIYSDSTNSLYSVSNVPKWQGMEIFKHLDDYKAVNAEDYYLSYEGAPGRVYGSYLFVSDLTNNVQCTLNNKNDPSHETGCSIAKVDNSVLLNETGAQLRQKGPLSNGFNNGKKIKVLSAGSKIFLPKMDAKKYQEMRRNEMAYENSNVSLTCVSAIDNNVACRNSANHGFVTEGAKITTF